MGWLKGKPRSAETCAKISKTLHGRTVKPFTAEHRRNIGLARPKNYISDEDYFVRGTKRQAELC